MCEKSYKTRSEASASSRGSEVRQKASLAKMRLSQAQRTSQMEQQKLEQQKKLEQHKMEQEKKLEQQKMEQEKKLEQQKMELEQQKMEQEKKLEQQKMELDMELEKQKVRLEAEMKMRAIADKVEQLELEARLIEEEENGDYLPNPVQEAYQIPQLAALNKGGEDAPAISADKPTPNDSNRTARWVHDQTQQIVHTVNSTQDTWIDALEARDQAACGTATTNGAGALSCPLPRLTLEKFDGDPLHWPRWIALFKALVHDRRELSNAERLTHLQTSLTGAARHAVSGLLCDGSLYSEALRELQCQFGSRATVVQASLRSVLQLPAVRNNDIPGLTELSRAFHATVNVGESGAMPKLFCLRLCGRQTKPAVENPAAFLTSLIN